MAEISEREEMTNEDFLSRECGDSNRLPWQYEYTQAHETLGKEIQERLQMDG